MPWFYLKDNTMDLCNPENYRIAEIPPSSVDGLYLNAIFADEIPEDPDLKPDIEGTPGLMFYIIRALATSKGQPHSTFPPVPLEVRMSNKPASIDSTKS
jgi:hypothetical protein